MLDSEDLKKLKEVFFEVEHLFEKEQKLEIEYEAISAEALVENEPETYDIITCMEMLEHVPDPTSIVNACAKLAKPNGDIFFSTINRNLKSFLFAIIGAEYILNLLPKGTHEYEKLIRPSELDRWIRFSDMNTKEIVGISYNPIKKKYSLSTDTSVNYILHAIK